MGRGKEDIATYTGAIKREAWIGEREDEEEKNDGGEEEELGVRENEREGCGGNA